MATTPKLSQFPYLKKAGGGVSIEKAAAAPDAINEATPGSQPPAQTAPADGKKAKPAFDKADESSSKHKKKKGLAKLNPF